MRDLSHFYKELETSHGKEIAAATEELYSLFDDGIYKWLASLWDGEAGGFYYSVSARDNDGFYPDMESTSQAINNLSASGIVSEATPVPLSMQKKMIAFMKAKQDPEDGYFYHAQWGRDVTTSRRARDLGYATSIIRKFGDEPLYPTATERIKEATRMGTAFSEGSTVPEHLRSEKAFSEYLESLGINEKSYSVGHIIGQQVAEIKAAGLTDVCIKFLNSKQKPNGFWEDTLSHSSSNGMMKISCAYVGLDAEVPNLMTSFDSALEVLLSDLPYGAITDVFNPPFTLLNLFEIMEKTGDKESYALAKAKLRAHGAELLRITRDRLLPFKKPDGSFSYNKECSSFWSQGKPVCIEGSAESDVNANSLAGGSRVRTLKVLDIPSMPLFDERDAEIFYALCGEK